MNQKGYNTKMKKRKKKTKYAVVLVILLFIFVITAIWLYRLENTIHTENQAIEEYRKQCEILNSKSNSADINNSGSIKSKLINFIREVDIIFLQTTTLNFHAKTESYENGLDKTFVSKSQNTSEPNIIPDSITNTQSDTYESQSSMESLTVPEPEKPLNATNNIESEANESLKNHEISNSKAMANIDCILKIPSIKLEKPVYNQNTASYLESFYLVTAYDTMYFNSGGTYIIYGHNSYVKGLAFQALPKIQLNDIIIIECMNSDYEFNVVDIQKTNSEQISSYLIQEENKLVLIACTNQSTKSKPEYFVVTAMKKP